MGRRQEICHRIFCYTTAGDPQSIKCSFDFYLRNPSGDELFKRVDDILFKPEVTAGDLIRKSPEAFKDLKTPYFMFDLDRIKHNIRAIDFNRCLPEDVTVENIFFR